MQNEPRSDHQREEDIYCNRNREVWDANVGGYRFREVEPLRGPEGEYNAHCYVGGVRREHLRRFGMGTYQKMQSTPGRGKQ